MSLSNFQSDLNTTLESEKPWSVTEAASCLRPSDIVFGSRSSTRKKGANKSGFPANRPVRTDEPVTRKLTIKLKDQRRLEIVGVSVLPALPAVTWACRIGNIEIRVGANAR